MNAASPWAATTGPSRARTAAPSEAAAIYTLTESAKLNGIDPQAWLGDVLARIADHRAKRIHDLLPWNWAVSTKAAAAA